MSKVLTFFVFKRKKPLLSDLLPCHSCYSLHPDFVAALTALILVLKKCIRSMILCVEIRFSPWPTEQILICLILRAFLIYFHNRPPPAFTTMKRFSLPFYLLCLQIILTIGTDNHSWPLYEFCPWISSIIWGEWNGQVWGLCFSCYLNEWIVYLCPSRPSAGRRLIPSPMSPHPRLRPQSQLCSFDSALHPPEVT